MLLPSVTLLVSIFTAPAMCRPFVLRQDSVFLDSYLRAFGYENQTEYPDMLQKYQTYTLLTLPEVLQLPRCANRDQQYAPISGLTGEDTLRYMISSYPGPDSSLSRAQVDTATREAGQLWGRGRLRLQQTRDSQEADFFIRFCQFSECLPTETRNLTDSFDLTGFTMETESGTLEVLVNTEQELADEVTVARLAYSGILHSRMQLKQVLVHQFGHVLSLPHLSSPDSAMSPFYLEWIRDEDLHPSDEDFSLLSLATGRRKRISRKYGKKFASDYLPIWFYNK